MVYTAGSVALATLEMLVHTDSDLIPDGMVLLQIEWPDDAATSTVAVSALPDHWQEVPAPPELAAIGDEWVRQREGLVLKVPSAVIHPPEAMTDQDCNYLLNPAHPDTSRVRVARALPFQFDGRLINS